jgi:RimJ/RimL family protein N-acetyltransferase
LSLAKTLDLIVPEGWPEFPEILFAQRSQEWPLYLFIDQNQTMIVGSGGFTCAPDANGEIQIGYEIAPAFRGQGIATQAMSQVLTRHPSDKPIAYTTSLDGPSASVLRNLCFSPTGNHTLQDGVVVWRWHRGLEHGSAV